MIRRHAGFTLVEVLIALGLCAVIGLLAYTSLSSAILAGDSAVEQQRNLQALERTWQVLSRDLDQMVIPPEQQDSAPVFVGNADDGYLLRLLRLGWPNPLQQPRSGLQQVGYRVSGNVLWRDYWPVPTAADQGPASEPVLQGLDSVRMRFLDPKAASAAEGDAGWQPTWVSRAGEPAPVAVELVIESEVWGELRRLFPLPAG